MEGSSNKIDKRFIYSILLFIAIVLIGATLRSPISPVRPLVPFFTEELNRSTTMVGFYEYSAARRFWFVLTVHSENLQKIRYGIYTDDFHDRFVIYLTYLCKVLQ